MNGVAAYGWGRRAWFGKVACMPQPTGPQSTEAFVGRSRELAVLSAAWRQAAAGDARLALVSGEPGIGKTELARVFAQAARDDGALVLWGSAWEEGGAPPYWPWVQVLRSYARQAGAAALADAAGPQAAVLGQLLPELGPASEPAGPGPAGTAPTGPGPAGSGSGARLTLFEAACTVLDPAPRSSAAARGTRCSSPRWRACSAPVRPRSRKCPSRRASGRPSAVRWPGSARPKPKPKTATARRPRKKFSPPPRRSAPASTRPWSRRRWTPRPDRWPGSATTPPLSACSRPARMPARCTGS